jgi:hypothetical protein
LAARIVCQYAQADWIFDFICEVYQANFVYGQNISQTETIENILKKCSWTVKVLSKCLQQSLQNKL